MENSPLSEREQELLKLVATGASNKEISSALMISVNTVKVHLRNIYTKLDVSSRTEAAMWAVQNGLVDTGDNGDGAGQIIGESDAGLESDRKKPGWFGNIAPVNRIILIVLAIVTLIGIGYGVNQFSRQPSATPSPVTVPSAVGLEESRWKQLADMPTARAGLAAAAYDNQIYAIAGEGIEGVLDVNERYDPRSDTWDVLTPKPIAVTDVQAGVVGGRIFVPGGRLESGEVTEILEIYDPRAESWSEGAKLPQKMSAYALATYEGKIYLFGGWDGESYLYLTYVYDPDDDAWEERTPMPTARGFAGAAEAGGKIFVIGGFDGEVALDVNEVYEGVLEGGEEGPWGEGIPMPEGRYGMGVSNVGGNLLLISGKSGDNNENFAYEYLIHIDEWRKFPHPFGQVWEKMGVAINGTLMYLFGGEFENQAAPNNYVYTAIYTVVLPIIGK